LEFWVVAIIIVIIIIRILVNDIERRRTRVGAVKLSQNTSGMLVFEFFVNFVVVFVNDSWYYGAMVMVPVIGLWLHDDSDVVIL
jgi:hypothetical protein